MLARLNAFVTQNESNIDNPLESVLIVNYNDGTVARPVSRIKLEPHILAMSFL